MLAGQVVIPAHVSAFSGGVLYVKLEEVSRSDAPALVLAEVAIPDISHQSGAATSVPFEIDACFEIVADCDYRMSAWLSRSGDRRRKRGDLSHDRRYSVLTRGCSDEVTIQLMERL